MDASKPLIQWVIYNRPTDYPDGLIARKWEVYAGMAIVSNVTLQLTLHAPDNSLEKELQEMRKMLHQHAPYATMCIPRAEQDDPKIVEVWM